MIEMLRLFLKDEYFQLYTHFGNFRIAFSTKIDEMQLLAHEHEDEYSKVWLDELVSTCKSLRDKIQNYTGELKTISLEEIPSLTFT